MRAAAHTHKINYANVKIMLIRSTEWAPPSYTGWRCCTYLPGSKLNTLCQPALYNGLCVCCGRGVVRPYRLVACHFFFFATIALFFHTVRFCFWHFCHLYKKWCTSFCRASLHTKIAAWLGSERRRSAAQQSCLHPSTPSTMLPFPVRLPR